MKTKTFFFNILFFNTDKNKNIKHFTDFVKQIQLLTPTFEPEFTFTFNFNSIFIFTFFESPIDFFTTDFTTDFFTDFFINFFSQLFKPKKFALISQTFRDIKFNFDKSNILPKKMIKKNSKTISCNCFKTCFI